jgi:S1-C subfamily serine protease
MREIGLAPAGGHGEYFQPFGAGYRNVLAKLEGSDETLRDQVVVVGAHYDHVGYGNRQNSFGPIGQIHNGADDNASGSAGLVELAEACCLLAEPPRRTILFAGWDAEEKGLLGSKHWIAHPTLPSSQVVAMIDMDMIGRLRDNHLIVFGSRTGYGWRRLLSTQNEDLDLAIDFSWAMRPDADHYPFFDRQIPVLMVNTNLHDQYHRPGDDANLINSRGIERVARLLFGALYELANRDQTPAYRDAARRETEKSKQLLASRQPARQDRLGAGWDDRDSSAEGVRLTRIVWGSPAHRAALRAGDRIVEFAGRPIHAADDLSAVVMSATSPAEAVVNRPGSAEPLAVSVPLDGAPMRLGIRWRLDDAEPGTIALTEVLPGSPAELAGLAAGDHVYQIAGRDFADEAEFAEQARSLPGPIELTVERDGQLRTVEIRFDADSLRRAA